MSAVPSFRDAARLFGALDIGLQPKQDELWQLVESGTARWILFAGAQGAAKSAAIRRVNLLRRASYPGTGSLIFRRTLPELKLNHIQPMFRDWPELEQFYTERDRMLVLPNASWTYFGSADNKAHLDRIGFGPEFLEEYVDEGQQLDWEWQDLLHSRNRTTSRVLTPVHVIAGNPGGRGHSELKRRFIDRQFRDKERSEEYAFIPAHAWDNVEWARAALEEDQLDAATYYAWSDEERKSYFLARTERGRAMDQYPPRLRAAYLEGSWTTFVGQAFDVWDSESHPVDIGSAGLEAWHPRWISFDWGFNHKTVVLFHASKGGRKRVTYREMAFRQTPPEGVARAIVSIVRETGERITDVVGGGDINDRHEDEQTVLKRMNRVLLEAGLPAAREGNTDRAAGYGLIYDLLATRDLLVTKNCPDLISTLSMLKINEDVLDDVEKVNGDDAYDALKVGHLRDDDPIRIPAEQRVQQRIADARAAGLLPSREHSPTDLYRAVMKTAEEEGRPDTFRTPAWARGLRRRKR